MSLLERGLYRKYNCLSLSGEIIKVGIGRSDDRDRLDGSGGKAQCDFD